MTEPYDLVLEHLKRIQQTLAHMDRKLDEHGTRLSSLESGQALIVQHIAHLSAGLATNQLATDNNGKRLDRIERRLDLVS